MTSRFGASARFLGASCYERSPSASGWGQFSGPLLPIVLPQIVLKSSFFAQFFLFCSGANDREIGPPKSSFVPFRSPLTYYYYYYSMSYVIVMSLLIPHQIEPATVVPLPHPLRLPQAPSRSARPSEVPSRSRAHDYTYMNLVPCRTNLPTHASTYINLTMCFDGPEVNSPGLRKTIAIRE